MNIYVASSWRNGKQPAVVEALRNAGHEVYDFRHPSIGDDGFQWTDVDPEWQGWDARKFRDCLQHPVAQHGFDNDWNAMQAADACMLVMPCGRSAACPGPKLTRGDAPKQACLSIRLRFSGSEKRAFRRRLEACSDPRGTARQQGQNHPPDLRDLRRGRGVQADRRQRREAAPGIHRVQKDACRLQGERQQEMSTQDTDTDPLKAENARLRGALRIEFDLQMWGRQMTFAEALQISDVIGDITPEMAQEWGEHLTPDVLSGYTPHVPTEEERDGLTERRSLVHGLIVIVEAFLDLEGQERTEVTEHALVLARADMKLAVQQLKGVTK